MAYRRRPIIAALLLALCAPWSPGATIAADYETIRAISRSQGRPLSHPFDVAVDRNGVLFLLESGSRSISIYSPRGEFLREIQGRGAWKDPSAIAVDSDGTIFLADGVSGRVLELEISGKIRKEHAAGGNARLTGVGLFGGSVLCADNRNHRIVVFRKAGGAPEFWGKRGEGPGELHSPFRLAVDPSGRVFVTDVMNARVQWFSPFGKHLGTLKRFGAGEGKIFRPTGIALDPRGKVWVGDSYTGLVQLFDLDGTFVKGVGAKGRPNVFSDPVGLAVSASGIWVADQKENRVGMYGENVNQKVKK
jgi:tripartite motif-containing protein 71